MRPLTPADAVEPVVADMAATFALNRPLGLLVRPVHATVGNGDGHLRLDDDAFGRGPVPGFVKIDVEGAEVDVLRGAERLLCERGPGLVVEVHSPQLERECGVLLVEHGYRITVVNRRRVLPDHRPAGRVNRWLVADRAIGAGDGRF